MTIECNKDEAEKCIEIAEAAFAQRKYDKAERFAWKAERLYPSKRAKDLLERVKTAPMGQNSSSSSSENFRENLRRRNSNPQSQPVRDFTPDQVEAVKRINQCKDYYEALGVTKESTDSDIKKAYKKLALQLHPDKNQAPGAAEAFKTVGNAAAVLTDPEKRKQYDQRDEEPQYTTVHHNRYHYHARGFESDLTAEELFNMFFGAGQQRVYTRRRFTREPEQQREQSGFIQLLPILLLIFLSLMSGYFVNDPVYSLTQNSKYSVARETVNLKVPYYVKENFHTEYQGSMRRLEMSVEEEYLLNLRHACQRERNYRETLSWKAKNFGDAKQFQEAQRMRMPSCEKLHAYNVRY